MNFAFGIKTVFILPFLEKNISYAGFLHNRRVATYIPIDIIRGAKVGGNAFIYGCENGFAVGDENIILTLGRHIIFAQR